MLLDAAVKQSTGDRAEPEPKLTRVVSHQALCDTTEAACDKIIRDQQTSRSHTLFGSAVNFAALVTDKMVDTWQEYSKLASSFLSTAH